mmetsp:Transcript_5654/g.16367  ORF Transcript_5654/g.16367 Transcript_5654/m.16367 type:complete len:241 (-) Transcript_5654:777-1499(-)
MTEASAARALRAQDERRRSIHKLLWSGCSSRAGSARVVLLPLLLVAQHAVCLVELLELLGVAPLLGMLCHHQSSELGPDLLERGGWRDTEEPVVVLVQRRCRGCRGCGRRSWRRRWRGRWGWPGRRRWRRRGDSASWHDVDDLVVRVLLLRFGRKTHPRCGGAFLGVLVLPCESRLPVWAVDLNPVILVVHHLHLFLGEDRLGGYFPQPQEALVEVVLIIGHPHVDHLVDTLPHIMTAKL